jgi:putative endonuclease
MLTKRKLLADKKLFGPWAEKRCEKFLKKKGLKTLTKNFSCKTGEIDLIMTDRNGSICFIEVKARADESFSAAADAVNYAKKTKLAKAARYFLSINNINDRPCRFDVITLVLAADKKEMITHYPNAFTP